MLLGLVEDIGQRLERTPNFLAAVPDCSGIWNKSVTKQLDHGQETKELLGIVMSFIGIGSRWLQRGARS